MKDGCTREHKHRYLRLKGRRGRLVRKVLRVPVLINYSRESALRSRFAYEEVEYAPSGLDIPAYEYRLSLLGLLHGLIGLTLVTGSGDR